LLNWAAAAVPVRYPGPLVTALAKKRRIATVAATLITALVTPAVLCPRLRYQRPHPQPPGFGEIERARHLRGDL